MRVLLASELGAGLGHASHLAAIARLLAPTCTVHVALREPALTGHLFAGMSVSVHVARAPFHVGATAHLLAGRPFAARDFADILARRGWSRAETLLPQLAWWDDLLEQTRPALVVADFAPTAVLAARGRVPVIRVGSGFCTAPADAQGFPVLDGAQPNLVPAERLLETLHAVLARRSQPLPQTLPDALRSHATYPLTVPALDPYATVRAHGSVGPLPPPPAVATDAKPGTFVAYLTHRAPYRHILLALAACGYRGSAYVRGLDGTTAAAMRSQGLYAHHEPLNLPQALADAAVVVHQASAATAHQCLALGRPQLVFPMQLEQGLTAGALERLGVAVVAPHTRPRNGRTREQAEGLVPFVEQTATLALRAQTLASRFDPGRAGTAIRDGLVELGCPVRA